MGRKCKHDMWWTMRIDDAGPRSWRSWVKCPVDEATHLICCTCKAQLPWGESNDDDERVAIEMRAAEIAPNDRWYDEPRFEFESYGALCFMNGGTPGNAGDGGNSDHASDEWAGYLAQVIRTHRGTP
jgi:hypothetical protein